MVTAWVATLALGCAEVPSSALDLPSAGEAGTALLQRLEGQWIVEATTWSDCPVDWQRPMPTGQTSWRIEQDHLIIEAPQSATPPAELWPADAKTLVRTMDVALLGCTATESLTLVIDEETSEMTQGHYGAELTHDGSDACEALAEDAGLPARCETLMEWRAIRVGGT